MSLAPGGVDGTAAPQRRQGRPSPDAHPVPPSLARLHALRGGYLLVGLGLVVTQWPLLLEQDRAVMDGVVTAMLSALALLALVGVRYPVRMLPVLLFEVAWKLVWLAAVAVPTWTSGRDMDEGTAGVLASVVWVVVVVAVVPWRYAVRQFVTGRGERWR